MGTVEIRLFGALRVQRPGQPVSRFPTRRVKDLFSYLLLKRHALHAREALADLFWDPAEENNPRHCLNTALWRLNRALGEPESGEHPYLRVDAQHIGFNTASDCRLDVAEFENRCLWAEQIGHIAPDQRATLYQQAISLYQADLLVDCYEEWCLRERDRLRQMYLRALDHLIDYHASRDEHVESIDCALRLLAYDPLREDINRKLIRAYLASGQAAAALRQYQECQSMLQRDLNSAPSPETKAMLPEILQRTGVSAGRGQAIGSVGGSDSGTSGSADGSSQNLHAAGLLILGLSNSSGEVSGLAEAVAQLTRAVADFDRAQAQLRQAATSVEHIAQGLLVSREPDLQRMLVTEAPAPQLPRSPQILPSTTKPAGRNLISPAA
jgi:DNA-binding SARP family transcriptional activator